jgi:hypothetical protein
MVRLLLTIDLSPFFDFAGGFTGEILARLQQSAGADLGDFFGFTVAQPTMQRKTGSREV